MKSVSNYCQSSIGRKQIVAVTGLMLIGFVIAHLAGNLFIYLGPDAFNAYAKKLAGLRPGLYILEAGLLGVFLTHMWVTALLVLDNINARGQKRYARDQAKGARSLATRLMPFSGMIVLAFVIWHLLDFTFIDHHGPRSVLGDGNSYGLYGVVYNSFADPMHSVLYIISMVAVGFHLYHGVESFFQTFGFTRVLYVQKIKNFSAGFAIFVTAGFSSIPVYVMVNTLN